MSYKDEQIQNNSSKYTDNTKNKEPQKETKTNFIGKIGNLKEKNDKKSNLKKNPTYYEINYELNKDNKDIIQISKNNIPIDNNIKYPNKPKPKRNNIKMPKVKTKGKNTDSSSNINENQMPYNSPNSNLNIYKSVINKEKGDNLDKNKISDIKDNNPNTVIYYTKKDYINNKNLNIASNTTKNKNINNINNISNANTSNTNTKIQQKNKENSNIFISYIPYNQHKHKQSDQLSEKEKEEKSNNKEEKYKEEKLKDKEEKIKEKGEKIKDKEEKTKDKEDKLKEKEEKLKDKEDKEEKLKEKEKENKLKDKEVKIKDKEEKTKEKEEKLKEKENKLKNKEEKNDKNPFEKPKKIKIIDEKTDNIYNDNPNEIKNIVQKITTSQVGLRNLGNTCFMNTCLQNLIHSTIFIYNLFQKKDLISPKTPISFHFKKICEDIKNRSSAYSPDEFKMVFGKKHDMFLGYRQHDTQEFCRILLEDMNSELNEVENPAPYKELTTVDKNKKECDKEFDEVFRKRENSLIMETFYGQIINIFRCKCGFETYSFQKILDLPLLLPEKSGSLKLTDLLDEYFKGENIQFGTKCEKCNKKTEHEKEIKISQPPNILILSLQRTNGRTQKKNDSPISFPEELNISKYIDSECGHKNESNYSLYGIGNHHGSLNFGHYYAYIKLNDKDWYQYNDSFVSKLSYLDKNSDSAYVLFYKLNK